jgi:hypothetical protein
VGLFHRLKAPLTPKYEELELPIVSLLAIAAVLFFGIGDALRGGDYSTAAIVLVLLGVGLVWSASWLGQSGLVVSARNTRIAVGLAFEVLFIAALRFRGGLYATGRAESLILVITAAAAAALAFVVLRSPRQALAASVLLVGGACIAMIIASSAPRIDVWEMFQAASRGLLHGHNVYTQRWSPNLPGESRIYTYFPSSAVVLAPFYALFGDVRFGVMCAWLVSAVLIGRMTGDERAATFGALVLLYPFLTFSVEQSWSEPLILVGLLLMALAVVLTFQQYDLIFVPMAAVWPNFGLKRTALSVTLAAVFVAPWALAAPHSFGQGVIVYQVHYVFAWRSLSVFHQLSNLSPVLAYAALVASLGAALLIAMTRVYKGGSFLMSCGIVLATLDLFDRISFFNEWQLAAGVVLAAGAEALSSFAGPGKRLPSGSEGSPVLRNRGMKERA